jgi:hypothetical protein
VCSGGNISPAQLRELLEWDRVRPAAQKSVSDPADGAAGVDERAG